MRETLQALVDHAGTGSRVRSLPIGPAQDGDAHGEHRGPAAVRAVPLAALQRVAVLRHRPRRPTELGWEPRALERVDGHRVLRVVPRSTARRSPRPRAVPRTSPSPASASSARSSSSHNCSSEGLWSPIPDRDRSAGSSGRSGHAEARQTCLRVPRRLAQSCARNWSALRAAIAMIAACGFTPGASGSSDASLTRRLRVAPDAAEAVGAGRGAVLAHAHRRREVHGHQVGAGARRTRPTNRRGPRGVRTTGPPAIDGYSSVAPAASSTSPRCTRPASQPAHVGVGEPVRDERRPQPGQRDDATAAVLRIAA